MWSKKDDCNICKTLVKCDDCKCFLQRIDAQRIDESTWEYGSYRITTYHYCPLHKKNYSRRSKFRDELTYYKEMVVDEHGEPVGYKKVK